MQNTNAYACLLGDRECYGSDTSLDIWLGVMVGGATNNFSFRFYSRNNHNTGISTTPFIGNKALFRAGLNGFDASLQGDYPFSTAFVKPEDTNAITITGSVYLLNMYTNAHNGEWGEGTRCKAKVYRLRIYEGDTLLHEFVPWKDGNNVVCMKDTVTGNLKYNIGTGSFTYGTDS